MNSLELLVVFYSSTYTKYNISKFKSHRHFHKTTFFYLTSKGKYFCTLTLISTHSTKSSSTIINYPSYIGISFHIIDICRFLPITLSCWERWFKSRHTSLTFQRSNKSSFFTTNKSTSTGFYS